MNRKCKFYSIITEDKIGEILEQKYTNRECPICHENSVYAACIEKQYNKKLDREILLSFDVFCKSCGEFLSKWDNTNRNYFFTMSRRLLKDGW